MLRLLIFVLLNYIIAVQCFLSQTVAVKGKLMCGNMYLANAKVKLWDRNAIGRDTQLAETVTDLNGNFQMQGGTKSLLKMDVYFKVYHDCEDSFKPCQRKVALRIPDQYVTRGDKPEEVFNAGTLNMSVKYPGEERSCIN